MMRYQLMDDVTDSCCDNNDKDLDSLKIDQTLAVENRYGAAAHKKEACLCNPADFNPKYLKVIPNDVIAKDYGCGDPTRWVKLNDNVLDLGSGSGKNAFICSQIVGTNGSVIGIDRNTTMLSIAEGAKDEVARKVGYSNVSFRKGAIESLDKPSAGGNLIVNNSSIDIVVSNCVLNLVNPSTRAKLLENIKRVLKPAGRIAISDIVSSHHIPVHLQKDPDLWSGCISGAWQEDDFIRDFKNIGFKNLKYEDRSNSPWKIIEGIKFYSITLTGHL